MNAELIRKDLGSTAQLENCVVCGSPTTKQQENQSWDCLEFVCYDSRCETVHWRETSLPGIADGNEGSDYDY